MKRTTNTIIYIFLTLFPFVTVAQISTNEKPISFKFAEGMFRINDKMLKTMPSIDLERLRVEDAIEEKLGIPPRFGYSHKVDFSLENSGEWFDLQNGDKLWNIEIYCSGALSINLLYDKFWLPDGAKFFIYSSDREQHFGAFTSENIIGDKEKPQGFATGIVLGDRIILEYYLPKEVSEQGIISICNVVQGYRYIRELSNFDGMKKEQDVFQNFNPSGSCQVNVNCTPEGDKWQNEKNAVALILVGEGDRMCTGFLINNTNNDFHPYFMTANHCLYGTGVNSWHADAIPAPTNGGPNLPHWIFYWHYESIGCSNPIADPITNTPSTTGAFIVANNYNSDFALLRLTQDPKNNSSVSPYYLGWDRSGNYGTGGVCIHHSAGDIKKIATYVGTPTTSICFPPTNPNFIDAVFVRTETNHSVVRPVSSGSPLINSDRKVIGQLLGTNNNAFHCPEIGCHNVRDQRIAFGKFYISWTGSNIEPRRRLRDWLNPSNTTDVLDGLNYCNTISLTNTQPEPPRTFKRVECRIIEIENATVPAGTRLELKATKSVIINPGFVVNSGATFIIR